MDSRRIPLRISPRHLGPILSETFCPCCYWHQILLGFDPPFAFPMPGIMHNLDRFEKQLVDAHFAEKDIAPRWLRQLHCVEVVEFPAKMTMEFARYDITLVGMPDAVLRKKDGTLYVIDYKTARSRGDDDPFMSCYQVQLNGYAELLEDAGVGKVTSAALVYFENQAPAYADKPLDLLSADGFNMPFAVKIHPVDLDRKLLPRLLKRFREYADMSTPPEGLSGCEDCEQLRKLFEIDAHRRNSDRTLKNADSYQRRVILNSRFKAHSEQLAETGQWENDLDEQGTECFDGVPADWDL